MKTWAELWAYFKLVWRSRRATFRCCTECDWPMARELATDAVRGTTYPAWRCRSEECEESRKEARAKQQKYLTIDPVSSVVMKDCYSQNNQHHHLLSHI